MDREAMSKRVGAQYPSMISVPPGWESLFERLVMEMEDSGREFAIFQAKEKFGGLRVYEETGNFEDLIKHYEGIAAHTCQECGAGDAGLRTVNGWMYTLCGTCTRKKEDGRC